ncbi:MAG: protein-L-isoaspartate O-methyltransferase, partial [Acidobacteria bacterium RBG_16_68_9]
QTISQPYVVALMSQMLALRGHERVLEIGTGSGYQAAVLSHLARDVYTIEIDPTLAASADERLAALGHANVHVRTGDGFLGWPDATPFDAIVVTAAAPRIPEPLVIQLVEGGRLVMPIGPDTDQRLVVGVKRGDRLDLRSVGEVRFVPMTGRVRTPERSPLPTPGASP